MKQFVAIGGWLLILGIAGCVHAPEEKIDVDRLFNFESGRTPYSAAICIARNARSRFQNITAEERLLGDASWEVIVRAAGRTAGTLAVAQVHNNGIGSMVSVRLTTLFQGDHANFARQLMADCQARMIAR